MTKKNITIALLDDNKVFTDTMSLILNKKGFNCIAYNNPELFLSELDNISFDFLILDLMMPEKSGEEVLKELSERGQLKKRHILIYSAKMFPREAIKDYPDADIRAIRKPTSTSKIIDIILEISGNKKAIING